MLFGNLDIFSMKYLFKHSEHLKTWLLAWFFVGVSVLHSFVSYMWGKWFLFCGLLIKGSFDKLPLEKELATHSSILAWEIRQTEEPGELQFMGSQRIRHD